MMLSHIARLAAAVAIAAFAGLAGLAATFPAHADAVVIADSAAIVPYALVE